MTGSDGPDRRTGSLVRQRLEEERIGSEWGRMNEGADGSLATNRCLVLKRHDIVRDRRLAQYTVAISDAQGRH